jgi:hypothetical protein
MRLRALPEYGGSDPKLTSMTPSKPTLSAENETFFAVSISMASKVELGWIVGLASISLA